MESVVFHQNLYSQAQQAGAQESWVISGNLAAIGKVGLSGIWGAPGEGPFPGNPPKSWGKFWGILGFLGKACLRLLGAQKAVNSPIIWPKFLRNRSLKGVAGFLEIHCILGTFGGPEAYLC